MQTLENTTQPTSPTAKTYLDPAVFALTRAAGYDDRAVRLWYIARTLPTAQRGDVERDELYNALPFNISPLTFKRILAAGEGIFWQSGYKRLVLKGWKTVYRLLQAALIDQGKPEAALAIHPQPRVLVDLSGSLSAYRAHLYAAWLGNHRGGEITIRREMLGILFNCHEDTLRNWEKIAGIRIETNRVITAITDLDKLPTHAYKIMARATDGAVVERYAFQTSNTYLPQSAERHPHRGMLKKVRKVSKEVLRSANLEVAGSRIYFKDSEQRQGKVWAYRRINRAYQKDGRLDLRRMKFVESRHGVRVHEYLDPIHCIPMVNRQDRLFAEERSPEFQWRRWLAMDYLRSMDESCLVSKIRPIREACAYVQATPTPPIAVVQPGLSDLAFAQEMAVELGGFVRSEQSAALPPPCKLTEKPKALTQREKSYLRALELVAAAEGEKRLSKTAAHKYRKWLANKSGVGLHRAGWVIWSGGDLPANPMKLESRWKQAHKRDRRYDFWSGIDA